MVGIRSFAVAALALMNIFVVSVVAQDSETSLRGVPARPGVIASELSESIAESQIVLVGEAPHYAAEIELVTREIVLSDLFASGFRYLACEESHALGWIHDMYATGSVTTDDIPAGDYSYYQRTYDSVRELNSRRPADRKVHVQAVDVNHLPWAFRLSLDYASNWIGDLSLFGDVLDTQFGGPPPYALEDLTNPRAISALQRRLHPLESSHAEAYREELLRVLGRLQENEASYRSSWGDLWYDRIVDLTRIEHASSHYRETQSAEHRETVMHHLLAESVRSGDRRIVALLGARHAQKSQTSLFSLRSFASAGERLNEEFRTFHLILYAISGERLEHLQATGPVVFDYCAGYPAENLLSTICSSKPAAELWLLDPRLASNTQWFGRNPIVPAEVWDALVVFREVTVRDEFR